MNVLNVNVFKFFLSLLTAPSFAVQLSAAPADGVESSETPGSSVSTG